MKLKGVVLGVLFTIVIVLTGRYTYRLIWAENLSLNEAKVDVFIGTNPDFDAVLSAVGPYITRMSDFKLMARVKRLNAFPKAGRYVLEQGMNNREIIDVLRSKNEPILLKFNNQERIEDLAGALARQIEPDSLTLLEAFKDPEFLESAGVAQEQLLSLFIPNTYEIYWNTDAERFRQRMLGEYKAFWNEKRLKKAKAIGLSPLEVSALAAVVQKESVKVSERPTIAGVYLNRIRRNIPLQADPTVIYAKKKMDQDFQQVIRRVLYRDLSLDSPYNTYKYKGLPPGPITMPDISSIDAVLNAEPHGYYYFVADPERPGYHSFSKSLSEHNAKRKDYIKWISAQGIKR